MVNFGGVNIPGIGRPGTIIKGDLGAVQTSVTILT